MKKRITASFLLIAMLAAVSCGGEAVSDDTTAPADTTVESSEDYVDSICLLRTADGVLVSAFADEFLWNTIWDGNVCTLLLPAVPDTPGSYVLSIYLNGGWLAEVEFTVE